ncbi:uncharacterized protein CPUR_04928 [Claviceps purpurea 20.1]|uniref:Uncharacterized protein n=1 Tax=Claviceps purpurea (strain 20.1) TaxID=1111077 RepID=M1VWD4_CLAP2|nr:uncharacterized protein CPUR_04928 [Claviceps purpurea 20.1]
MADTQLILQYRLVPY